MIQAVGYLLLAFLLSLALTPVVRFVATRFKVMDAPGGRKIHDLPRPLLGGIAIFASFTIVTLLAFKVGKPFALQLDHLPPLLPLLAGGALVVVLGVVDDMAGMRPATKFLFQCAAGLILIGSGVAIRSVSDPSAIGSQIGLGVWGLALSFLWVVGITNALNLIDGLDGLASGVSFIAAVTFAALAFMKGEQPEMMVLSLILAGAIGGFLRYNFYPASIFLGDTGSLFLGYMLASVSIVGNYKSATLVSLLVPILALGLPIMDTVVSMARRLLRSLHLVDVDPQTKKLRFFFFGESAVWNADQDHIHHRLLKSGLSQRRAVMLLYGVSVLLALGALSLNFLHGKNFGYFLVAVGLFVFLSIRRLGYQEFQVSPEGSLLWVYRHRFVGVRIFQAFSDLMFILFSYLGALTFAAGGRVAAIGSGGLGVMWLVVLVQSVTFVANGFYKGAWRYTNLRDILTLTRGVFLACLISFVLAATWWSRGHELSMVFLNQFFILAFLVVSSRLSYRILSLLRKSRRQEGQKVLIYGAGEGGAFALREIINNPELGLMAVGFLDDDPGKRGKLFNGMKILGGLEELDGILSKNSVTSLIVSSGKIPLHRIEAVKDKCSKSGVQVRRLMFNLEQL